MTPYSDLPDYQFHSRSFVGQHPSRFDPIVNPRFYLGHDSAIMTMGSCFAQHLSKWLLKHNCNLLVGEDDKFGGGVFFSGNYGNVYTTPQAVQLVERALGQIQLSDEVYVDDKGRYFDPLRPSVMPKGLNSKQEVLSERIEHEKAVRELLLSADVIVFTLGLTETWLRLSDEAILPIAPGVVAGNYSENQYKFKNFNYNENLESLEKFISLVHGVNPTCKILLTVSPVPLAATYENKHVCLASAASKAILRSVIEPVLGLGSKVDYFPSYEIFYTPGIGGGYFEPDGRHVKSWGVDHAMRLFNKHYIDKPNVVKRESPVDSAWMSEIYGSVICDEDRLV